MKLIIDVPEKVYKNAREDMLFGSGLIANAIKNGTPIEQEPCDDAVSRQAVLESIDVKAWEFCDYLIRNGRNDELKPVSHFAGNLRECVGEDLPPVTPQPNKWIPVETELPEVGIDVLVCDMEGTIYLSHRSSYGSYFDEWGNKIKNIRAWMPLPTPPNKSEIQTGAEGSNKE